MHSSVRRDGVLRSPGSAIDRSTPISGLTPFFSASR